MTLLSKLLVTCGAGALGLFVLLALAVALIEAWEQSWTNVSIVLVLISTVVALPMGIWLRTR